MGFFIRLQVLTVAACLVCLAYTIVNPGVSSEEESSHRFRTSRRPVEAPRRAAAARSGPSAEAVLCRNCSPPTPTSIKSSDPEKSLGKPLFPYRILWNVDYRCNRDDPSKPFHYLVAVNSLPENYALRQIMRAEAWEQLARPSSKGMLLLFFLGMPRSRRQKAKLRSEIARYGDIVVGDYYATPENSTLTSLMIFRWTSKFCRRVRFLVKANDGAHVDYRFLRDSYDFFVDHSMDYEMFGSFVSLGARTCQEPADDSVALRNCSGVLGYLVGCAYVLTADVVEPLLYASATEQSPPTPPEDLYVTGTLADSVSARRAEVAHFEGCYVAYAKKARIWQGGPLYWLRDHILALCARIDRALGTKLGRRCFSILFCFVCVCVYLRLTRQRMF
ncbi:UDP-GalNAc:beta-1,3-N-acetylgalactosaminyltransferase 1-like [Rhipicephalus sanguineus]|uniref:UDP-GalNAc:beta-1, 3-N-acetylgalactosaminyltransferase 1-like n=1 Tax=Rhipicephalus sanguineus TaxID=34632 RepID=UPI001896119B|nr:UDP-GalNAc:beta-1,3-N-acetylgalactosaminyltransferase 1-like [Rhipicephalus sanguineus]